MNIETLIFKKLLDAHKGLSSLSNKTKLASLSKLQ